MTSSTALLSDREVEDFLERHGDYLVRALEREELMRRLSPPARWLVEYLDQPGVPEPRGHLLFNPEYMEALRGRRS